MSNLIVTTTINGEQTGRMISRPGTPEKAEREVARILSLGHVDDGGYLRDGEELLVIERTELQMKPHASVVTAEMQKARILGDSSVMNSDFD